MKTKVIIRQNNYWGSGKDLREARANYKKASSRQATPQASVVAFKGSKEHVDNITVDDVDGNIGFNTALEVITIQ